MTCFSQAYFTPIALTLFFSTPAIAVPISEIEKRDFNKDGYIERGAEIDSLGLLFSSLNGRQQSKYGSFVESDSEKIAVTEFNTSDYYDSLAENCLIGQNFFLQEGITDFSLHEPSVITPSKRGALFSANRDYLTDITSWTVKGAVAWLPQGSVNRCLHNDTKERPIGATLTAYGLAPYISFSGTGNSSATGISELTFGALSQFQFFGGVFDLQELNLTPSYRTDFQGQAEIFGLSASWRPYHFESRLNGLQGDFGNQTWDWSLGLNADYLNVRKAGNSGLTQDTQHTWIGGVLGVGYTLPQIGANGLRFSADVEAHRDVSQNINAIKYSVGAVVGLSDDGRTSLDLRYENGKEYKTLKKIDGVSLNLRLSF